MGLDVAFAAEEAAAGSAAEAGAILERVWRERPGANRRRRDGGGGGERVGASRGERRVERDGEGQAHERLGVYMRRQLEEARSLMTGMDELQAVMADTEGRIVRAGEDIRMRRIGAEARERMGRRLSGQLEAGERERDEAAGVGEEGRSERGAVGVRVRGPVEYADEIARLDADRRERLRRVQDQQRHMRATLLQALQAIQSRTEMPLAVRLATTDRDFNE